MHATAAWEHATLGLIRGVELWATAEQQGRTADLQDWLLRTACGQTVIAGGIHTESLRAGVVAAGVQLLHGRALPHGMDLAGLARLLRGAALVP